MLQIIRSKAGGIFVKLILGILVLSFALWGIADMFRTDDNSATVASLDGFKVTKGQMNQDLYRQAQMFSQMFGQEFGVEKLKAMGFEQSYLQNKLDEAALSKFSHDFKLGVGESQVRDAILKRREFQDDNGRFDAARYKLMIERGAMNEASLVRDVKRGLVREAALSVLVPAPISAVVIDNTNAFKNEKRTASFVKIAHKDQTVPTPTDEQVAAYHKDKADKFMAPEYRSFQLVKLSPTEAAEKTVLSDDELKKEYEKRVAEYTRPDKRDAVEYLVKDAATGKLVKAAVMQGKAADKVVEEIGKDKVTKKEWGLVTADEIPAEIKDSVMSIHVNEVSDPIESKEGFHVIHIKKVENGGVDSFDIVKESLAKKIKIERATDDIIEKTNKIDDQISEGKSLEDIAAAFSLTVQTVALVDAEGKAKDGDQTKPVFDDLDIVQAVFSSSDKEVSSIRENKKGEYFSVNIKEIVPSAVKPLEVVKADVVKAWTEDQQKEASKKKATELLAEIKKGTAIAAAATGLTVETSEAFKRDGDGLKGAFPMGLVKALFKGDKGTSDMGLQGDAYIVAVTASVIPAPALEAKERESLVKSLEAEQKSEFADSFLSGLKKRYHAHIAHVTEKAPVDMDEIEE